MPPANSIATHDVTNQSVPLEDYNLLKADTALREAVRREGAAWAEPKVADFGAATGSAHFIELGRVANKFGPELKTHDRYGHRVDTVEYHPDRKSTRLNSSHIQKSRMPSSA